MIYGYGSLSAMGILLVMARFRLLGISQNMARFYRLGILTLSAC
jgi:hypothetical protein